MGKCILPILALYVILGGVSPSSDRRQAVPVLYVTGSHYEVGHDIGRVFGTVIKSFLAKSDGLRSFEAEYKTEAGQKAYDKTLANMKKKFPYYVKEMQGVADGADVPFYQLFLLQMDDIIETVNDNQIPRNDTGGCSSVGISRPGNTILGHTEDALDATLNHFYIMSAHIIPTAEDKEAGAVEERFASLCYAGHMPGYTMGYNANGLVFSINTLSPLVLKPGNTPRTFITRAMLASKNFADAERILLDKGLGIANGFSVNMIWTDKAGHQDLYNVEVAPDLKGFNSLINVKKFDKEPLIHCNIYSRLKVTEVTGDIVDSSHSRLKVIYSYPVPKDRQDIQNIISDTSAEVYRVFATAKDAPIKTIAAGIFDLQKSTWSIYIDKPNSSEPVACLPIQFTNLQ